MIYVSSSCIKCNFINESVKILAESGFSNIELSGGTNYYDSIYDDLILLKKQYNLNYLIHNYFPPPREPFILNIGSLNKDIHYLSVEHAKQAIRLAKRIGATKYGLHAGFFFDPKLAQIGKRMDKNSFYDKKDVYKKFCETYNNLSNFAGDLPIYIENNVLSGENYESFNNENPFMLTNFNDYLELKEEINFQLILDIAHLYVSCTTLKIDFDREIHNFAHVTDYIHISDNDGNIDSNNSIQKGSPILKSLSKLLGLKKTITLETYGGLEKIKESYNIVKDFDIR